jgi:hypothetical protein
MIRTPNGCAPSSPSQISLDLEYLLFERVSSVGNVSVAPKVTARRCYVTDSSGRVETSPAAKFIATAIRPVHGCRGCAAQSACA